MAQSFRQQIQVSIEIIDEKQKKETNFEVVLIIFVLSHHIGNIPGPEGQRESLRAGVWRERAKRCRVHNSSTVSS